MLHYHYQLRDISCLIEKKRVMKRRAMKMILMGLMNLMSSAKETEMSKIASKERLKVMMKSEISLRTR